jgi:hypothetical protein
MILHIILSLYLSHWVLVNYQHIYVISIFSLIFSEGFLRSFSDDISIHPSTQIDFSSDFSHRGFREVLPYDQTTNEDYKTTRRRN